ncbi:MAG: hypothetical protein M1826_003942 [Phylliscum demangeonii]|nr:MAG: hypothetical protein M1826_003942 [Phylliscum demangeonii]
MPSNKARLYLALYARLKDPNTYHYALHVSPKHEGLDPAARQSMKHHCINLLQLGEGGTPVVIWTYEAKAIDPHTDDRILARVLLGKIQPPERPDPLESVLAAVPARQDDASFNCAEWISLALRDLERVGLVRTKRPALDWGLAKKAASDYVGRKKREGRYDVDWKGDRSQVATYDLMLDKEIAA